MQLQSHPLLASALVRLAQLMGRCGAGARLATHRSSVGATGLPPRMGGAEGRVVLRAVAVQHAASCDDS